MTTLKIERVSRTFPARHGNAPTKALTTCTFDQTDAAPDGSTFRIAGSATGLIR